MSRISSHETDGNFRSQLGQDRWVLDTLYGRRRGTFLEIGANDGVRDSNTFALERDFDWTGWLLEGNKSLAEACRENRRAKVLNYYVAPVARKQRFYDADQWGGLVDFTRLNLAVNHQIYNSPIIEVPTVRLSDVLRPEHLPKIVDYLSIDLEGAEYPVLEEYFSGPHSEFRRITVEIGRDAEDLDKLCELLVDYKLYQVVEWDAYFVHERL